MFAIFANYFSNILRPAQVLGIRFTTILTKLKCIFSMNAPSTKPNRHFQLVITAIILSQRITSALSQQTYGHFMVWFKATN